MNSYIRSVLCALAFTLLLCPIECRAQISTGMSGLIKNPSADMNAAGEAVIAGYYINSHLTPSDDKGHGFYYDGKKYDTFGFSLSLTPFSWLEIGYTFTLLKTTLVNPETEAISSPKFNHKDRYFSIKVNPLKEGKYHPAISIGSNDFLGSPGKIRNDGGSGAGYFCNYYIVATKHFLPKDHDIGLTLGYRYVPVSYGKRWQGLIAGATWNPKWFRPLRVIGEWTANELNLGADCLLWKHFFIQAALVNCRYPTGGVAFRINLL